MHPDITDSVMANAFGAKPAKSAKAAKKAAKAMRYQDIYADIQAQREAAYDKEVSEGQFTKEFQGLKGYEFNDYRGYGYLGEDPAAPVEPASPTNVVEEQKVAPVETMSTVHANTATTTEVAEKQRTGGRHWPKLLVLGLGLLAVGWGLGRMTKKSRRRR